MMKTEIRPPESLKQHPLHEGVPMNTDDHPDMVVIVESMRAEGFNPDHPIKINASGEIMDGRHRARAAVLAGLVSVPVVIKDDSEAENIIVNSLLCRRHFSKEMFAYVLYPLLSKNALQKGQTLKNARKSEMSRNATSAAAELESRGISRDIWYRAQQLRVAFAKRPKLREKFEPRLCISEAMIVSLRTKGNIRTRRLTGIVAASRHLGVSRQHVYDVVHGHRRSRKIEAWLRKNLKEQT